ncbi:MAG: GntR family transcriptional regulator [Alphaproteobacteria bacterium]|nr:GntR family transcriptional regulator [Alphaproteobacteria bacterium]
MDNTHYIRLNRVIPEELADILQAEIIHGRLTPESRLTEEEIALRYGVSRSPVREALRLLEADGLVVRAARRGIWVAPLSLRDLDEIYACRVSLEGIAAEQAAKSDKAALKERLVRLLPAMQAAADAGDVEAFFDRDVDGSALIYQLADNTTLNRLLRGLNKQALRYRYFAYSRRKSTVSLSMKGTAAIVHAIAESRAARARTLTEELIGQIWEEMRPVLSDMLGPD